jgi:hypothetical protein
VEAMNLKSSSRNKWVYAFLSFILISLLIVAYALNSKVHTYKSIKNSSSPLLKVADCDRTIGLIDKWKLDGLMISQDYDKNNDEFVSCSYFGYIDNNQKILKFMQFSYRIISPTTRVIDESAVLGNDFQATEKLELKILPVGEKEFINCEKNEEQYSCVVGSQYKKSILFLRFWSDGQINIQSTEKLINDTLSRLDKSIQNLEKE